MRAGPDPFSFLVVSMAGWLNQKQQQVIDYPAEENRVLREQIGCRRLRFNDDQRRRLAAKANCMNRVFGPYRWEPVLLGERWSALAEAIRVGTGSRQRPPNTGSPGTRAFSFAVAVRSILTDRYSPARLSG